MPPQPGRRLSEPRRGERVETLSRHGGAIHPAHERPRGHLLCEHHKDRHRPAARQHERGDTPAQQRTHNGRPWLQPATHTQQLPARLLCTDRQLRESLPSVARGRQADRLAHAQPKQHAGIRDYGPLHRRRTAPAPLVGDGAQERRHIPHKISAVYHDARGGGARSLAHHVVHVRTKTVPQKPHKHHATQVGERTQPHKPSFRLQRP